MKIYGAYAINPDSGTFVFDEAEFNGELSLMNGEPGFYYPHYFEDGSIANRGAYVIARENTDNLELFRNVYGIYPTKVYKIRGTESGVHLVFDMDVAVQKHEWTTISEGLAKIYGGIPLEYHYYGGNNNFVEEVVSDGPKFKKSQDIRSLTTILFDNNAELEVSKDELAMINEVNLIEISEICKDIGLPDEVVDPINNIHPKFGKPYQFIVNIKNSANSARKWLNETYGMNFPLRFDIESYRNSGEKIIEGKDFFLDDVGYYCVRGNDKVRQTDFSVNVHYRIIKPNEISFVVSLYNPTTNETSKKFEWSNIVNKNLMSEIIQKMGNFHFIGGQQFLTAFHAKLCEFKDVPEISSLIGYGFHRELGIAVFENGIFDITQKIFTPKTIANEDFLFNYDGKGYLVIDKHGTVLSQVLKGMIPRIMDTKLIEMTDLFKFVNKLYSDDSGELLLMQFFGNAGYAMFSDERDITNRYPIFFVRGTTGSGKSTYVEILQRAWGMRDAAKSFEQTSNFTISVIISYLRYVPMFLSEFRESVTDVKTKGGTIRSMFDGTGQSKGRPDQTIVNYDYKATMVLDGEEMFMDGAIRTRCVQKRFIASHKIAGDFAKEYRGGRKILDSLLYTYLNFASKDQYQSALDEGHEIFRGVSSSSRVCNNMRMVYAGCMAIYPKNKDRYIEILKNIAAFQEDDLKNNSTGSQIIKAMARFIEQSHGFDDIYVSNSSVIVSWGALEEYIKMRRIDMSLKNTGTYKEHLEEMGYKVGYEELHDKMVYGVIIPKKDIPKEFLTNTLVYQAWKSAR